MHASSTPAVRAEPNVAPMIDVMLVLLVIFMAVVPALLDGFTATPPRATNLRAEAPDHGDHVLGIDARGRFFVDRVPVARDRLPARLRALRTAAGPGGAERPLYVTADRALDYRTVQDALDAAAASGAHVVALVAERSPAPPR